MAGTQKGAGATLFGLIIAHCLRGDKTRGVIDEIGRLVNVEKFEATLMAEEIAKSANPQKALLALVATKRSARLT